MKYIGIIFLLNVFILGACDMLDIEPKDAIEQDQVFENEEAYYSAVIGCYDALQQTGCYGGDLVSIPGLLSDNLKHTGTTQEYKEFQDNNVQPDNPMIESIWNSAYDGINRCNMVINNFNNGVLPDDKKNEYLGHAHFLRALHYFNLVRFFGGVPIKLQATTETGEHLNVARKTVDEVYALIESDLDLAEQYLPGDENSIFVGAAIPNTAMALRSMVKLTREEWAAAANFATMVINSGEYDMLNKFDALYPPEHNDESIFDVEFNNIDNNRLAQYFLPADEITGGRHEWEPTTGLIDEYGEDDNRLPVTIKEEGSTIYGGKYTEITTRSDNCYVIRLAEMYLVRAEANARLQQNDSLIREDLHKIKLRANEEDSVFTSDYDDLLEITLQERKKEFAFEGKHWFDLLRTAKAIEELYYVDNENQLLMPIPLAEIQTNSKMTQNPGY